MQYCSEKNLCIDVYIHIEGSVHGNTRWWVRHYFSPQWDFDLLEDFKIKQGKRILPEKAETLMGGGVSHNLIRKIKLGYKIAPLFPRSSYLAINWKKQLVCPTWPSKKHPARWRWPWLMPRQGHDLEFEAASCNAPTKSYNCFPPGRNLGTWQLLRVPEIRKDLGGHLIHPFRSWGRHLVRVTSPSMVWHYNCLLLLTHFPFAMSHSH